MGFYYFSIFSLVPLSIAYGVLALFFWGIARGMRDVRRRGLILAAIAIVFLIVPIAEEVWIAWNFGQACKEAGTFVHKKVQVEGFYDDTRSTHAGTPTPQAVESFEKSGYRFLEMKGKERFVRIEKIDGHWESTVLDRPTARYHFMYTDLMNGTPWGHKITRTGSVVIDKETGLEIARYVGFGRDAPWYFIGLDRPGFACDAPSRWPYTRNSRLIYEHALIPSSKR